MRYYNQYESSDFSSVDQGLHSEPVENNDETSVNVIIFCVFIIILSAIFIFSIAVNVSILMVFARKQTLRTTSNRYMGYLLHPKIFLFPP